MWWVGVETVAWWDLVSSYSGLVAGYFVLNPPPSVNQSSVAFLRLCKSWTAVGKPEVRAEAAGVFGWGAEVRFECAERSI